MRAAPALHLRTLLAALQRRARSLWHEIGLGLVLGWLLCTPALAQLPVPALSARVIDSTNTLSPTQRQQLETKLATFEQSKGSQVVILMVPSTQPEDIAAFANRVASTWKIGRKEVGDGLLLIVAKEDRKVRLEVARTLEGAIPDLTARRIIAQAITPRFKQGDFHGGLDAALDHIFAYITGEALPVPDSSASNKRNGFEWMDLVVFMFIAIPVVGAVTKGLLGNKLGSVATGGVAGLIAWLVTTSLLLAALAATLGLLFALFSSAASHLGGGRSRGRHWGNGPGGHGGGFGGGFGGGGGGGGGFSSGGGGSFGGGGASGDW